ncbi:MAG: recombinase family protein [Bdellovibrionota bacterium]|mgnify:CR=1 FL=1
MAGHNQSPTQYSTGGYLAITLEKKFHNPLEDASFLQQKYVLEGLSTNYIAYLVGCSHQAVASALMRHKIPRRESRNQSRQMLKGQEPFGYKMVGGKLVLHKGEQKIIAWMRIQKSHGASLRQIVFDLKKKGIPTKNRSSKWHPTTVMKILAAHREQR